MGRGHRNSITSSVHDSWAAADKGSKDNIRQRIANPRSSRDAIRRPASDAITPDTTQPDSATPATAIAARDQQ